MQVTLAEINGKPYILELTDGIAYINNEPEVIKNLTEAELQAFQTELDGLPRSDDPGYEALVNSVRAAFLAKLLGKAVGDESINHLTHILDHVHYEVQKYLGEVEE